MSTAGRRRAEGENDRSRHHKIQGTLTNADEIQKTSLIFVENLEEPSSFYTAETHKHGEFTQKIIGVFYEVYRIPGYGFLERVYQNALSIRLRKAGLDVVQNQSVKVYFDGEIVGEYFADIVVADAVILELKAARELVEEHHAQLLNYLKATTYEVALLLNFGPKPQILRKAYDNTRKKT